MTWEKICISDLGRVVTGDTPPKNRPEYYGSAYPFIKPTDMKIGHRYTHSYEESYSDEASEKYIKKLIPKNSTAVVTIGSIGQKLTLTHAPCFVNQAVNAVIPDASKFNPLYVFYLLRHNLHLVKNADTGASSGRENVSKSNFSGLELLATLDLNEQGRIAAALDSQDSLIENNRRRIILLEEAAQLLRHKFYADIGEREMNGNLPPSLTRTTLAAICDQIKVPADPAKIASETPYLSMEHMTPKSISLGEWDTAGTVGSLKLQFQENDVLFGRIRPYFHKVGIAQTSGITSTDMIVVRAKCEELLPFVVLTMSSDEFVAHAVTTSNGTKMPRADWKVLKDWEVLIPASTDLNTFAKTILPIFEMIKALAAQNRALTIARDQMLPKLMSGEIKV